MDLADAYWEPRFLTQPPTPAKELPACSHGIMYL